VILVLAIDRGKDNSILENCSLMLVHILELIFWVYQPASHNKTSTKSNTIGNYFKPSTFWVALPRIKGVILVSILSFEGNSLTSMYNLHLLSKFQNFLIVLGIDYRWMLVNGFSQWFRLITNLLDLRDSNWANHVYLIVHRSKNPW
jgi:hypothetical protein